MLTGGVDGADVPEHLDPAGADVHVEQGTDAGDDGVDRGGGEDLGQLAAQQVAGVVERVDGGLVELAEGDDAGGDAQRVAGERAALVERGAAGARVVDVGAALRFEQSHDVGPAAVRADRQSAADDLAHGGQVRGDADACCAPPVASRSVITSSNTSRMPSSSQVARIAARYSPVAGIMPPTPSTGSDQRRHPVRVRPQERVRRGDVVVRHHQGLPGAGGGDAAHLRHGGRRPGVTGEIDRRPYADHDVVDGAVVAALRLGDHRATGERPREAQREHHRLGAGPGEPDPLQPRHPRHQQRRQLGLQGAGEGVRGAVRQLLADGGRHVRVGVAQRQAGVVGQEVAVDVAVDVPHGAADATVQIDRVGRPGVEAARLAGRGQPADRGEMRFEPGVRFS